MSHDAATAASKPVRVVLPTLREIFLGPEELLSHPKLHYWIEHYEGIACALRRRGRRALLMLLVSCLVSAYLVVRVESSGQAHAGVQPGVAALVLMLHVWAMVGVQWLRETAAWRVGRTMPLKLDGHRCKRALDLVSEHPEAAQWRDAVLASNRELTALDLAMMKGRVQDKEDDLERRRLERACRELHRMPSEA